MDMSVVLPQPDGPTSAIISPKRTSRSTPRSARTMESPVPKVLNTCLQTMLLATALIPGTPPTGRA